MRLLPLFSLPCSFVCAVFVRSALLHAVCCSCSSLPFSFSGVCETTGSAKHCCFSLFLDSPRFRCGDLSEVWPFFLFVFSGCAWGYHSESLAVCLLFAIDTWDCGIPGVVVEWPSHTGRSFCTGRSFNRVSEALIQPPLPVLSMLALIFISFPFLLSFYLSSFSYNFV